MENTKGFTEHKMHLLQKELIKEKTPEAERKLKELNCVEMINSILCYGDYLKSSPEEVIKKETRRLNKYIVLLGEDKVKELIKGQQYVIKGIKYNVYTDYEGCSYNSLVYIR